jgi:hypothetical protein
MPTPDHQDHRHARPSVAPARQPGGRRSVADRGTAAREQSPDQSRSRRHLLLLGRPRSHDGAASASRLIRAEGEGRSVADVFASRLSVRGPRRVPGSVACLVVLERPQRRRDCRNSIGASLRGRRS